MTRLRKTQRRRRQRAGNRKLQVAALVAAISPELAKSQDIYQLAQTWWNEGGIANSKALADGIMKSIEKSSKTVTLSVNDIAQELMKERQEQDHTVHNALTSPPSVAPTELPDLPTVLGSQLRDGETYTGPDGVTFIVETSRNKGKGVWEIDTDNGRMTINDKMTFTHIQSISGDNEEEYGGKRRRRPRRKTLRKKK